ncbi:hypothetical protein CDAR_602871 [Caerostris darwini]|uniref:Uncharacterized protein n=1 Tax=Caerostris darwini TaxID=1538125 RepID=A0AAV4WJA9_9ARAC|nr:hypothetical protein CDAR_602871 [Caerostris darwini]
MSTMSFISWKMNLIDYMDWLTTRRRLTLDDFVLPDKPSVRKTSVKKTSLLVKHLPPCPHGTKLLILCPVLFQILLRLWGLLSRVTSVREMAFPIGKPLSIIFSGFTRSPWAD